MHNGVDQYLHLAVFASTNTPSLMNNNNIIYNCRIRYIP